MSDDEEITVDQAIRALSEAVSGISDQTFDRDRMAALVANRKPIIDAVLELQGVVGLITKTQQATA